METSNHPFIKALSDFFNYNKVMVLLLFFDDDVDDDFNVDVDAIFYVDVDEFL